jgi:arylsulfatase A-like enzyme
MRCSSDSRGAAAGAGTALALTRRIPAAFGSVFGISRRWGGRLSGLLLFLLLAGSGSAPATDPTPRPNLLVIIADDVGTDALRAFNADPSASFPPTPNLDSLLLSGVRFRNAYAYPTCSPTRATILTGRYGFRTGIGYALATPTDPILQASEYTLPEVFTGQPGRPYRHANIGKWHLSFGAEDPNLLGGWDHFSGVLIGALPSYDVWPKTVDGRTTSAYRAYATTDNVDDALAWVQEQGTQPWLLWLAFNAAHTPYHKPDNGLHGYDRLPEGSLAVQLNPRPYYEAMIEALDTEMGRLLSGIDRSKTTVVFLGDNGSLPTVIQAPYPADRGKGTLYQGGIRVPLIVSGPAVVRPNRDDTNVVHTVDLFATLLELAGADPAAVIPATHPVDSRSLVPILRDEPFRPGEDCVLAENFADALAPEVAGRAAIDVRYKLIRFDSGVSALYDLTVDPVEGTNLLASGTVLNAAQQAAHDRLSARLEAWRNAISAATATAARWSPDGFTVDLVAPRTGHPPAPACGRGVGSGLGGRGRGADGNRGDPPGSGSPAGGRVLSRRQHRGLRGSGTEPEQTAGMKGRTFFLRKDWSRW